MKNDTITLGRFVDPTMDGGFKALFCDRENLDVLKILVNSFLPADRQVTELEFAADREVAGFTVSERVIRVDLRCRDELGRTFIVEMQRQPQEAFVKRCLEYSTRIYSSQLPIGGKYEELTPVYLIAFMKWPLKEGIPGADKAIARYSFCELEDRAFAFDDISLIFVRLDKAKASVAECADAGERCLHYLANMYDMEEYPDDETFGTFFRKAEIAAFSPEKRDQYIADMISERDYENILRTARHDGQREGYAEGVAEGLEKGIKKASIAIAQSLLSNNIPLEIIAASTGLSIDEVRKLAE